MKNILPYRPMTGYMWDKTLFSREVCTEPTGAPPNAATACMECDVRAGFQSAQAHNILTDNSLSIASLPFCDHLSCTCTELANEEPGHMQLLNEEKQLLPCTRMYMCVHMWPKNWLFSALPLENPQAPAKCNELLACSLSLNTSSVVCYVQRAVQTE